MQATAQPGRVELSPPTWHQQRVSGPHGFAVRSNVVRPARLQIAHEVQLALRPPWRTDAVASTTSHPAFVTTRDRPSCRNGTAGVRPLIWGLCEAQCCPSCHCAASRRAIVRIALATSMASSFETHRCAMLLKDEVSNPHGEEPRFAASRTTRSPNLTTSLRPRGMPQLSPSSFRDGPLRRGPGIHTPDRGYGFRTCAKSGASRNDDAAMTTMRRPSVPSEC